MSQAMTPTPPDLIEKMLAELAVYSNRRQGMKAAARVMLDEMREWALNRYSAPRGEIDAETIDAFAKEMNLD